MTTRRHALRAAALLATLVAGGAGAAAATSSKTPAVPSTLAALAVTREDISTARRESTRLQAFDDVELYGLRSDDRQLQATLETGHFADSVPASSADYQSSVAGQVGGAASVLVQLDGHSVYVKTAQRLRVLIWFSGREMYVLSVRDTYATPKTLLRAAMAVAP